MEIRDFFQLRPGAGDEVLPGDIVDVNEFRVAEALLLGKARLLGQKLGACHLFGCCLHFGHHNTAAALLVHEVPGCELWAHHLGPYARPFANGWDDDCSCGKSWRSCDSCCYGFDIVMVSTL